MKNRFKNQLFFVLIFILFFNSISFAEDINIEDEVSGYLLGDFEEGRILEQYNIDSPLEIASITKLMTYVVVMDEMKRNNISMEDLVVVDKEVAEINGSTFQLKEGEKFPIKTLLESVLIVSANDSSVALAKYISGDVKSFVKKMNQKARKIGLENTTYLNPTGLPEEYGQNTMSIRDIFKFSRYILKEYPEILDITKKDCIDIENNLRDKDFVNKNTNPLLKEIYGVDGLKTGFTNKAGYCLVSTMNVRGQATNQDFRLIGIVMGTKSEKKRKEISKDLLEYGISNYQKRQIFSKEVPVDTIYIPNGNKSKVEVFPKRDTYVLEKRSQNILQKVIIDDSIELPLKKGDKVGKVILYSEDDEEVFEEIQLILKQDIREANFIVKFFRKLKEWIKCIFN